MSSSTFRELLSKTSETVERPRALAPGHYIGTCRNFEYGTSRQKQTPFVRFIMVPEEETSDVTEGANQGIDLSRKELSKTVYITPASLYRLSDLLDAMLGKQPGRSLDDRIPETRGIKVMFQVTSRESEDGSETYNDVGTVVAA